MSKYAIKEIKSMKIGEQIIEFKSVKFEIIKISTEKRLFGDSIIEAKVIGEANSFVTIKVPTCNINSRDFVRYNLLKKYNNQSKAELDKDIKIGEVL